LRLLAQQHATVDNLRSRATTLLSSAAIVVSLLGGLGVVSNSTPLPAWTVAVFVAILGLIGLSTIAILWPIRWVFGLSPNRLIDDYIEAPSPATLTDIWRDTSIHLQAHFDANERKLNVLFWIYRAGCLLFIVDVSMMLVALLAVR